MLRSIKKRLKNVSRESSQSGGNENEEAADNVYDMSNHSTSQHSSSTSSSYFYSKQRQGSNDAKKNITNSPGGKSANKTNTTTNITKSPAVKKKKQTKEEASAEAMQMLANFDACIYAAEALGTENGTDIQKNSIISARKDPATGLVDCSVLVSPDGDLLLLPNNIPLSPSQPPSKTVNGTADVDRTTSLMESDDEDDENDDDTNTASDVKSPSSQVGKPQTVTPTNASPEISPPLVRNCSEEATFAQLIANGKDDYDSAIFFGNDLVGDKALNGFSAKGWSIPATSHALYQTELGLESFAKYCRDLTASRQEQSAEAVRLGLRFRSSHPSASSPAASSSSSSMWRGNKNRTPTQRHKRNNSFDWELIDPRASDFEHTSDRVGPLQAAGSSLYAAIQAMEDYQTDMAERDSQRYKEATTAASSSANNAAKSPETSATTGGLKKPREGGLVANLNKASRQLSERVARRQKALEETSRKVQLMEKRLVQLKQSSDRSWEAVYQAEAKVTKRVEQILQERSREREKQRLARLRAEEKQHSTQVAAGAALGTTSEEIWDIVRSVAESMDNDSFEPMDLPSAPTEAPRDRSKAAEKDKARNEKEIKRRDSFDKAENLPVVSREAVEVEVGLPELRLAALKADEEIQSAQSELLLILSKLDTTRRSARTAAEACLVAAGNEQTKSLKSWIQLERASLEERLAGLAALDEAVDRIDVRADLDKYIIADKKARGGSSHLGDDDDGGVASALAALSSHVDGIMGQGADSRSSRKSDVMPDSDGMSLATLETHLKMLFDDSIALMDEKVQGEFEKAVSALCEAALDDSPGAAARRSALCYALNSNRSSNTEIRTSVQFDGLCRVFAAILTGCDSEEGGVSNAKMCIMLAQTFYVTEEESGDGDEASKEPISPRKARSKRIYIRSKLRDHPIWSKDDFWDEALSQQLSEALTQSGVMSNFEKQQVALARKIRKNSEWAQTRKTKWHDLNSTERVEAASQVHAVVFAQLGALAHSMIEFGCGLERSCAFVRRMCIRHQLPSSHRSMLLKHLMARVDVERRESS